MAEGRMLKKAVSTSRRLADLETDSARLLYTWIIPHLDIEGRFYADPSMIKGSVVPRIKSFTEDLIAECIQDMASVGLITVYEVDGDQYFYFRKFADHQNLNPKREAPSKIPDPPHTKEKNTLTKGNSIDKTEHTDTTPDKLQSTLDSPVSTPGQVKLREVKLRESTKALPTEEQPVDNSSHEQKTPDSLKTKKGPLQSVNGRWTEQLRNDLEEIVTEIRDRYGPNYHQQCVIAVQTHLAHVNPEAMIYCLRELIQQNLKGNKIARPKEWLNKAIHNQDGKINAAESEAEAQQFKAPLAPAAIGVLDRLGMSGFGVKPVRE